MSPLRIALGNMRHRGLSSALTAFLVAIGVCLVSLILTLRDQVDEGFQGVAGKFHLVVGPKGSEIDLILNAIFHMGKPIGNLPWRVYEDLRRNTVFVEKAIPIVTGDNYRGFYLVGTTQDFLTRIEIGGRTGFAFREGRPFEEGHGASDHADYEAVIGSEVARRTGLRTGSEFVAAHGVVEGGQEHHEHRFRVSGVLAATGTPHDRAIFCPADAVFALHEDSPWAREKMLSAVLVVATSELLISKLEKEIDGRTDAMAVIPSTAIRDLMEIVSNINQVLVGISLLVLLAAGISILVAIYNSMAERRRDIAILRALGAPARMVFGIIVIEAVAICLLGAVAGLILTRLALVFGAGVVREVARVLVYPPAPGAVDGALLVGTVLLGVLSSILPAFAAYRTDVATNLRPIS